MKAGVNLVTVKLDPENDSVTMGSGVKIQIDTSFEPEKHLVRTGIVTALPLMLTNALPWKTDMEIQMGDRVVMYYMAVMNCLSKERSNYMKEEDGTYIFIKYTNIYAVIRDGEVIPINGYLLIEPIEDPAWIKKFEEAKKNNIYLVDLRKPSLTNVSYGRIIYMSDEVESYKEAHKSDKGYDLAVGDEVVLRKIRDIPVEYELHAKIDKGRKLMRTQRFNILAKL